MRPPQDGPGSGFLVEGAPAPLGLEIQGVPMGELLHG